MGRIDPLGFARPINPSLNHHSISLKSIPTHNFTAWLWFDFWEQHLVGSVCDHNDNNNKFDLYESFDSFTLTLSKQYLVIHIDSVHTTTEELHLQQVTVHPCFSSISYTRRQDQPQPCPIPRGSSYYVIQHTPLHEEGSERQNADIFDCYFNCDSSLVQRV